MGRKGVKANILKSYNDARMEDGTHSEMEMSRKESPDDVPSDDCCEEDNVDHVRGMLDKLSMLDLSALDGLGCTPQWNPGLPGRPKGHAHHPDRARIVACWWSVEDGR